MTDAVKTVTKTAVDYFRQNQPVYTENELQEAIKLAHEAGVEAERKRFKQELFRLGIHTTESQEKIDGFFECKKQLEELINNPSKEPFNDLILANQGETK